MSLLADKPEGDDKYDGTELVVIDLGTDIFTYQMPLDGQIPIKKAKAYAADAIARLIVDKIEPDFQEMTGFELMKYRLIVKKYKKG